MRYSYKQILNSLPVKKNSNSSWWVRLLVRRVSFLFTYIFINLGFSSNGVSVLSIFVILAACVLFMTPVRWAVILAVILLNYWLVLDCVDGNIARCKGKKTQYGEFVDDVGGYYTVAFVYLSISVCACNFGGILIEKNSIVIVVLGALSSICDILARLIHKDYEKYSILGMTDREKSTECLESYEVSNKKSLSYIRRRIGKELGISGSFMFFAIISCCLNAFDLLTIFYFLFNASALIITTVYFVHKADVYDNRGGRG